MKLLLDENIPRAVCSLPATDELIQATSGDDHYGPAFGVTINNP